MIFFHLFTQVFKNVVVEAVAGHPEVPVAVVVAVAVVVVVGEALEAEPELSLNHTDIKVLNIGGFRFISVFIN